MAKPNKLVMVCCNRRPPGHPKGSCADRGSTDLLQVFSEQFEMKGLIGRVRLLSTSCLAPCSVGPVVSVQPDNVWYGPVSPDDAKTIVDEHLIGGKPVERLFVPEEAWE